MFEKILIPVDDSSCSERAGQFALGLAKSFGATLVVSHVLDELPNIYSDTNWAKDLLTQGQALLEIWQKKGNEANLTLETTLVASQDRAAMIVTTAQAHACDLIVMGTHGRKGLAHAFLGSVAERVTRLATLPVMLVRETKQPSTSATFQRILVAVDGSEASRKALTYADRLAKHSGAELHLVTVIPDVPPPLVDPIGVGGAAASLTYNETLKTLEQEARVVMEVSRAQVDSQKTVFHTARAQRERVADVLTTYAKEKACDLMVMGTHGRTGFDRLLLGSVAEGVAHNTTVPLLLVHLPQQSASKKAALPTASTHTPANTL